MLIMKEFLLAFSLAADAAQRIAYSTASLAPKPIKPGTKVSRIKLVEGDHNISCKIDGFGSMMLKSEFVKKA